VTENEFRFNYCELMQYYQLIEMHLRGICAGFLVDEDGNWLDRIEDYETDSLGLLVNEIQAMQKKGQLRLFTQDDFNALQALRKTRNYWTHQCFLGDRPVVFPHGKVKRSEHAEKVVRNLEEAMKWEAKITKIGHSDGLRYV